MNLSVLITGSISIVLIVFILFMMYRNRFNNSSIKQMKVGTNRLSSWLTNGAYVGYFTT
jgi:hypothetical protein